MSTLASAPSECCVKGVQHSGTPTGTVEKIAGLDTYVARPSENAAQGHQKILFYFADIWGPLYINSKLLQDYFASQGYLVLGIDYLEGDSVAFYLDEPGFVMLDWAAPKYKRIVDCNFVPEWIAAVKEKYGTPESKYSAVGYCLGAPFVMDCVASDLVSAGAFAHPAYLDEDHFRKVKQPLLMSCAENDPTFPIEARRKAEDILVELKATYHIQVFGQANHGFATRGDLQSRLGKWAKERSAEAIVSWFSLFCN
ncbi:alpha/beta-hydrolase [Obba rivulosa]|uniref:Alpha/beta-hydrolase n=1 Tax=Obba rivulosa TaxID=1052685 RepID=A0A8E2AYH4_9APHY|nr:alpha/beta-hydrolase [Obba rivulosa]